MKPFHLQIVTPEGTVFDGDAESLLVRTGEGDVEILAGHTDLFASVSTGRARILQNGKEKYASCSGGFLSVTKEAVKLVCITFEFADTIDIDRAKAAKERAEAALRAKNDENSEKLLKAKLGRAMNRMEIYERFH